MSASREKKQRQSSAAGGLTEKQRREQRTYACARADAAKGIAGDGDEHGKRPLADTVCTGSAGYDHAGLARVKWKQF